MKYSLLGILAVGFCFDTGNSFAQSTVATEAPAVAGTNVSEMQTKPIPVSVSYLGVFNGPGFSTELEGKTKDGDSLYLHNRPTLKYKVSDDVLLGIQPRFNIRFLNSGMDADLENWRMQSEFKNIFKTDIMALSFTPRISLPTSVKAHNQSMSPSPELLGKFDFMPKGSRFQFDSWYLIGNYIYKDLNVSGSATSLDSVLAAEANYQIAGSVALTFGYYMEHAAKRQTSITSVSNEIDVGFNWDIVKGWSVNPVIATECNNLAINGTSISKNMGLYVWVSGSVL